MKKVKNGFNNFWDKNIATKPLILSTTERSDTERKSLLEQQIISYVSRGWRLDTQTDFAAVLSSGKTHTVESITLTETTSTEKRYVISGSFSCTLRNSNNVSFPLTGKYRTTVRTLR